MNSNTLSNELTKINSDLKEVNTRLRNYIDQLTNCINSPVGQTRLQLGTSLQIGDLNRVSETPSLNSLTTSSSEAISLDSSTKSERKMDKLTMELEKLNTKINSAFSPVNSNLQSSDDIDNSDQPSTSTAVVPIISDDALRSQGQDQGHGQGWFDKFTTELEKLNSGINNTVSNYWNSTTVSSRSNSLTPEASRLAIENTPSNKSYLDNCIKCVDFTIVDLHATKFPRQFATSIPQLAIDLTLRFTSKLEKTRAIFVWLHHNIVYNNIDPNLSGSTPEEILQCGIADSQGYAELFSEIGQHSDLDVLVISRHGKWHGFVPTGLETIPPFHINHAWNAVQLETGEWHLLDACWGAGHLDERGRYVKLLDENHFRTNCPETFRLRHFPANLEYQMCEDEISWSEYILTNKEGPLMYSYSNDFGFSEIRILPNERVLPRQYGYKATEFAIMTKCEHTKIHPQDQYILLLSVDGETTPFEVNSQGTTWTCQSRLRIEPGSEVCVCVVESIGGESAKGVSVQAYLLQKGYRALEIVDLCKWDT